MELVRHFVDLLLVCVDVTNFILENAAKHMDLATPSMDIYFSTCRALSIGMVCLVRALDDLWLMLSLEKEALWKELSSKLDWVIVSKSGMLREGFAPNRQPLSRGCRHK